MKQTKITDWKEYWQLMCLKRTQLIVETDASFVIHDSEVNVLFNDATIKGVLTQNQKIKKESFNDK